MKILLVHHTHPDYVQDSFYQESAWLAFTAFGDYYDDNTCQGYGATREDALAMALRAGTFHDPDIDYEIVDVPDGKEIP